MSRFLSVVFVFVLFSFGHSASALEINFGALGNGSAAALDVGFGVSVTGSADVHFADVFSNSSNGGLGIGNTGVAANSLDAGEFMTINFGQLVDSVLLSVHDIPPFGNVFYSVSAMLGSLNLGLFAVPLHASTVELVDISALVGSPFDLLTVSVASSPPLGLVVEGVQFEPQNSVPVSSPATALLVLFALQALVRRRLGHCKYPVISSTHY